MVCKRKYMNNAVICPVRVPLSTFHLNLSFPSQVSLQLESNLVNLSIFSVNVHAL